MFLSRDNLPASSADLVQRYEKIHKNLVKRTRQLKRANHELAKQIAERKRVEEALLKAEQKYRSIFENAVEGIFQTTQDGRYIDCNPALARIYGYESAERLLASLTDIAQQLYVDPHRRSEFIEKLQVDDSVSEFESQVYRQDGSIIWISENARAVRDENGTLLYYEGFVTDITQRKVAEGALRQSEAELRTKAEQLEIALSKLQYTQNQLIQSEKMSSLGQLLASVAHEINNPVNCVCNNLTPAREDADALLKLLKLYAKHYPHPVQEIQKEAEEIELDVLMDDFPKILLSMQLGVDRIRQIVLSLQNFSRPDAAQMTLVDLHKEIDSTLLIIHNRLKPKGDNLGITVIKEYGELPLVECHVGLLNQVFMNLLCNAIDALEERSQKQCVANCWEELCTTSNYDMHVVPGQQAFNSASGSLHPYPQSHLVNAKGCENSVSVSKKAAEELAVVRLQATNPTLEKPTIASLRSPDSLPLHYEASAAKPLHSPTDRKLPLVDIGQHSGAIWIRTEVIGDDAPDDNHSAAKAVIRIVDNGLGITQEVMARIFDPFFTTKPAGKGTGLGLSISYQIVVEKHGGQLKCFSSPAQGTEFVIEIPIRQQRRT